MKIVKIVNEGRTYTVDFVPNWFEKLFGKTPETRKFLYSGRLYTYGGGRIYYEQSGRTLGNGNYIGEALDAFHFFGNKSITK